LLLQLEFTSQHLIKSEEGTSCFKEEKLYQ
jgi:hypothetical protein